MRQTKGAIGNLLNRYKAVLKKCHLLNTFGSLAVVSMLVMGGAGVAQAYVEGTDESGIAVSGTTFNDVYDGPNEPNTDATKAGALTINYDTTGIVVGSEASFSNFTNNAATAGGAIKALNGFTIEGGAHFANNIANGQNNGSAWGGGAIYIKLENSGTYSDGQTVTIGSAEGAAVVFDGNIANSQNAGTSEGTRRGGVGGAIAIEYAETVNITNATFTNNKGNYGGAIAAWRDSKRTTNDKITTLTITSSKFEGNIAHTYGGAVAGLAGGWGGSQYNTDTYISQNNTYTNNYAKYAGAFWNQGKSSFEGDTFTGNGTLEGDSGITNVAGGAIYNAPKATLAVKNSNFTGNISEKGGAINNFGGTITEITDSSFTGNIAENSMGGAISNQLGQYKNNKDNVSQGNGKIEEISNTKFIGNTAHNGGAIFNGENATIDTISSVTFQDNHAINAPQNDDKAAYHGGAITNAGTIGNIANSTFSENSTTGDGGAIANIGSKATLELNTVTITNNSAGNNGGGIYNDAGSSLTLDGTNDITGNTSGTEAQKDDDLYNAGTATVASGTTTVDALTNNGTINVGGEGSAATLAVRESWTAGESSSMNVDNLGTLAVDSSIVLAEDAEISNYTANVAAGGTYLVDGLDGTILTNEQVASLKNLLKEGSAGLLDLGAGKIDLSEALNGHGHYNYADDGVLNNLINDQSLGLTADVASTAGSVKGGFQNIHLTGESNTQLVASTLTLAGTESGTKLVYYGDNDPNGENAQVGDLRIGKEGTNTAGNVTLGLADKNNKGALGDVIFTGYTGKEVTLNAVGAGSAEFTAGQFIIGTDSNTKVIVDGATLKTTGFKQDGDYGPLDTASVNNGTFAATDGSMDITNVELSNNGKLIASVTNAESTSTDKGNIDISGTVHGQGTVDAQNTLTFSNEGGLTTNEGDVLNLRGNSVSFTGVLTSTDGQISIEAGTLTTSGAVTVKDDNIKAKSWILNDALTAGSNSVLQTEQFGTDTNGASSLSKTVTLNDNSLLVHGNISDTALKAAKDAIADANNSGAAYYAGKTLNLDTDGKLHLNPTAEQTSGSSAIVFGDGSMLIVDSGEFSAADAGAVFTGTGTATATVDAGSKLYAVNAHSGDTFTVFGENISGTGETTPQWAEKNILADTPMLKGSYAENGDVTFNVADPMQEFPGLSEDLAPAVTTLYTNKLNNVNASERGVRFLSRATNDAYLGRTDRHAAAVTIESAARMAFAGAVPQMTKMASDAATNAVVNRLGFANPDNGAKAMNLEGKLVDDKALGLALWIAPLWSNQTGFGMEAGNLDYGYNANLGGVSLGADYTWSNNFRAGLMLNIGGGYAESAGGDLSETTNSMTFWGIGAYGGWEYENFAIMGDVSYTSTWNSVDQDLDQRMGMGDLEADIQASAISAGLRFEYKLETQYLDLIPHVGARYMSINTWGYDVDADGGTILEGDGFQQNIWTFPVGITFSKELEMNNDWYFKPSVDFTVIPAAGDIKAKEDVRFTGLPYSTEIETQMMDYFTWQGGVGLEFGNDTMSVGVNYTLQAGQNSTGHGVFGMFRYEF